jgi:hypothetical protein
MKGSGTQLIGNTNGSSCAVHIASGGAFVMEGGIIRDKIIAESNADAYWTAGTPWKIDLDGNSSIDSSGVSTGKNPGADYDCSIYDALSGQTGSTVIYAGAKAP